MDPFLIPVQLLIIGLYLFRFPVVNRFPRSARDFFLQFASDMKLEIGKPWKTVLVPIIVIFVSYLGWILYFKTVFHTFPIFPGTNPLPLYVLNSGILAPVSEEILQCFFLSVMFILFVKIYKTRWMVNVMCFAALVIVSYIFANGHTNPTYVNWLLRFFQFMIFGALYYVNGRNLLPAIIAHSAWNMMVMNPFEF